MIEYFNWPIGACVKEFILRESLESCILVICAAIWGEPDARVTLILGDTVNPTAIINCLVNYIPSRDGAHMLVVDSAVAKPLAPFFLPSNLEPGLIATSYLITTIYHQVSASSL